MKKKKLKLSLNKMTVAKINDTSTIKGGSQEITYAGDASCPQTNCCVDTNDGVCFTNNICSNNICGPISNACEPSRFCTGFYTDCD